MDTVMQWALIAVVVLFALTFRRAFLWIWFGLSFVVVWLLSVAYHDVVGDL
jgi:hypothetical protein